MDEWTNLVLFVDSQIPLGVTMFTGIIETLGVVKQVRQDRDGRVVTIESDMIASDAETGASIAVNGVCLTIVKHNTPSFTVEIVQETLRRSTLGSLHTGDRVNLERPLRLSDRLDGHLVQGHVDGVGRIVSKEIRGNSNWFTLEIPGVLTPYLIEKGSIALDGISLTIAELTDTLCAVAIIPHTASLTTFGFRKVGDPVNIEVDLIGKYVESLLRAGRASSSITEEWLKKRLSE